MVKIFDSFFRKRKRFFSKQPKQPKEDADFKLKEVLEGVKNEMDEYLDAINENTNEIQTSYECINEISNKLEKLAERIEAIEIFLQQHSNFTAIEKSFDVKPLTKTEQHVFLVIYALEDEKGLVSYADIIKKTGLSSCILNEYIARLMEKGVPLMKKCINSIFYIRLNPEFKRMQAKENILMIDAAQKELVNF